MIFPGLIGTYFFLVQVNLVKVVKSRRRWWKIRGAGIVPKRTFFSSFRAFDNPPLFQWAAMKGNSILCQKDWFRQTDKLSGIKRTNRDAPINYASQAQGDLGNSDETPHTWSHKGALTRKHRHSRHTRPHYKHKANEGIVLWASRGLSVWCHVRWRKKVSNLNSRVKRKSCP